MGEVILSGSLSKCLSISLSEAERPNPMSSAMPGCGWFSAVAQALIEYLRRVNQNADPRSYDSVDF